MTRCDNATAWRGGKGRLFLLLCGVLSILVPAGVNAQSTKSVIGCCSDSGWQNDPNYTDSNPVVGVEYAYRVKARDQSGNETEWSVVRYAIAGEEPPPPEDHNDEGSGTVAHDASIYQNHGEIHNATWTAVVEDTDPPVPNPSEWEIEPYPSWSPEHPNSISMAARTAVDEGGGAVEYYFDCVYGDCNELSWSFGSDFQYNLDDNYATVEGNGHLQGIATLPDSNLSIEGKITFNGPLPAEFPEVYLIATDGADKELAQQIVNPYYFSYSEVAPGTYQFSGSVPDVIKPINDGHYEVSILVPYSAKKYQFFVNTYSLINEYYFPLTKYLIYPTPYIHQCYDTPKNFCGSEACGAASAVMLLAGMNCVVPWPNDHMDTCCESGCAQEGEHANDYGNYVSKEYTCAGVTWDTETYDYKNHPAKGAYGYIHHNPDNPDDHRAWAWRIQYFLWKHGIRGNGDGKWPGGGSISDAPKFVDDPDFNCVRNAIENGNLVIASTDLTGVGHIVLIRGYNADSNSFIVNDPFGSKPYDSSTCGDYDGNSVFYTWDEMGGVNWAIFPTGYEDLDNNPPPEPNNLGQFRSDGQTEIPFGKLITLPTVVFKGFVEDNSAPIEARDSVRLEIELKRVCQQFTGVPTHFSDFSPSWTGREVNIPVSDIPPGQYHWRARTVDIRGEKSPWVSAGNNDDSEVDFSIGIIMYLCSPADMIVTDPDGLIISKELNQIPGATYEEVDVNGDGDSDDKVSIPGQKVGEYLIAVIPEPDASPTDTYSLMVEVGGMVAILAENIPIEDIPPEPYEFESRLNRADFDSDGDVDAVDLDTFVLHWLVEDCNYPDWCEGADLNYNGRVDFLDFALFAKNWLWEKIPADLDINGDVDFKDYSAFALQWMSQDCNEPNWCEGADLDKSSSVDLYDLGKFAEYWLEGTSD